MRMLETIREYGAERLAERGELGAVRGRHAELLRRACMAEAEAAPARPPTSCRGSRCSSAERDNILAAHALPAATAATPTARCGSRSASARYAMMLGEHAEVGELAGRGAGRARRHRSRAAADRPRRCTRSTARPPAAGRSTTGDDDDRFRATWPGSPGELARRPTSYPPLVPLLRAGRWRSSPTSRPGRRATPPRRSPAPTPWTAAPSLHAAGQPGRERRRPRRHARPTPRPRGRLPRARRAVGAGQHAAQPRRSCTPLDGDLDGAVAAYARGAAR